ncbi:MAG: response regulator [Defluviitaleaceae bacterium]|nr:response regulator [Defluviitaleaceae bacterium]
MNPYERIYTILIVEDESIIVDGLIKSVKNYPGFKMIGTVNSETQALELMKVKTPDIVLVDFDMTEGNGISLMRLVRSDKFFEQKQPFFAVLTGFVSERVRTDLNKYADAIFLKNSNYRPDYVFTQLSFRLFDNIRHSYNERDRLKQLISSELEKYHTTPKKKQYQLYVVDLVCLILQHGDIRDFKLKELEHEVVRKYGLAKVTALHTNLDRYVKALYELTPSDMLKALSDPYAATDKPSLKDFLILIADKVRAKG